MVMSVAEKCLFSQKAFWKQHTCVLLLSQNNSFAFSKGSLFQKYQNSKNISLVRDMYVIEKSVSISHSGICRNISVKTILMKKKSRVREPGDR